MVVLDEFDKIKHFPDAREFLSLLRELVYYPDRIPMAALAVARTTIPVWLGSWGSAARLRRVARLGSPFGLMMATRSQGRSWRRALRCR